MRNINLRRTFTLIEVLLAMSLSALLLSALISVMGQPVKRMERIDRPEWLQPFKGLLLADLSSARSWLSIDDHLILLTHHRLQLNDDADRHRLIFVHYRVASLDERSWLIREEREVKPESGKPILAELITDEVQRFQMTDVSMWEQDEQAINATAPSESILPGTPDNVFADPSELARRLTPIPDQVLIRLWQSEPDGAEWTHRLVIR